MLSRYIPTGSTVCKTSVEGDKSIKAITVRKGGFYTLAVVNVSNEPKEIAWQCETLPELGNCKEFLYSEGKLQTENEHILLPLETGKTLSLTGAETISLPAESLILFTNFDY